MKRLLTALFATAAVAASANTVKVTPATIDLGDLDHYTPISWGFSLSGLDIGPGMVISQAVVRIKNIYNWNNNANKLFIDLIDNPTNGIKNYTNENAPRSETGALSDYFTQAPIANQGSYKLKTGQEVTKITTYTDSTPGTYKWVDGKKVYGELFEYSFSTAQIGKLATYLGTAAGSDVSWKNGSKVYTPQATVGLTFDADCHYYNTGVEFEVTTKKVPDAAATLGLLGLSLAGLVTLRRRR
jgi:hypothetical protein